MMVCAYALCGFILSAQSRHAKGSWDASLLGATSERFGAGDAAPCSTRPVHAVALRLIQASRRVRLLLILVETFLGLLVLFDRY